jgi:hypothetical protein
MKKHYPLEWVPATPDYILGCIQEEWRQYAILDEDADRERQVPTFVTTVHQWRDAMDLVWWSPLGHALNQEWRTRISGWEWFRALVPAREKTLRDVCNLLATQARRPAFPRSKLLGCPSDLAGVFLTVRYLLEQAGAPPGLRPSAPLAPALEKWPGVFDQEISRLAPGLLFYHENKGFSALTAGSFVVGAALLLGSALIPEPWLIIIGVVLCAFGWFGGSFGGTWFPGKLRVDGVKTFRGLTEAILEQQQRLCRGQCATTAPADTTR